MNDKAKKILGKTLRIVWKTVKVTLIVVVVLLLTVPLWIGPIARPTINAFLPTMTGTDSRIDKLYLNPYTANFEIGGVRVANPTGFSETNAVSLGYLNVDIDATSLFSDVIIIENIEIDDLYFSLVKNGDKKTNLEIIQEHILGAQAEYEKEQEAEWAKHIEEERASGVSEEEIREEQAEADRAASKKVIVNRVVFKNIRGRYLQMPLAVPSIEIHDIGKDSGGLALDHLGEAILNEFWESLLASAVDLGALLGDGAGKSWNAVKDAGGKLKDAGDAFKGAGDAFKDAGDKLKGAGDALKGLFK